MGCLGQEPKTGKGRDQGSLGNSKCRKIEEKGDKKGQSVYALGNAQHLISRVTESQNYRTAGVGRELWRPSSPTPLLKQGHLQQAAQDPVQAGLEYLQRRRLQTSLGSLFQGSVTLRGKKFFLMFRRNFLCFSLCPLLLVVSLGTTEKSLAPSS